MMGIPAIFMTGAQKSEDYFAVIIMEDLPDEIITEIAGYNGSTCYSLWFLFPRFRRDFCARTYRELFITRISTAEKMSTWMFGQLQSVDDAPAQIIYSEEGAVKQVYWKHRGRFHRGNDLPAYIDVDNGIVVWCKNAYDHRVDGPAEINLLRDKIIWKRSGFPFRETGPTKYTKYGAKWIVDNKTVHKSYYCDISSCAWCDNVDINEERFWRNIADAISNAAKIAYAR